MIENPSNPKVFVSILNWNEREMLSECLDSLSNVTDYDPFEIVVVDNGSEDGSVNMIEKRYPKTHLIKNEKNEGFSIGSNQAINYALNNGADYVLLLNNDTQITRSDWMDQLVSIAEEHPDIGVIGCKILEPDGTPHYDGRQFPLNNFLFPVLYHKYDYNRYEQRNPEPKFEFVDDVVGAVFLIKKEVIEDIGGLDEAYSPAYREESDYCVRVWNAGYKIAYTDRTTVLHFRHQTSKKLDGMYLEYVRQRNIMRFVFTNYPLSWIIIFIPMMLLRSFSFIMNFGPGSVPDRNNSVRSITTSITYAIRAYTDIILEIDDIMKNRGTRQNVKELLK